MILIVFVPSENVDLKDGKIGPRLKNESYIFKGVADSQTSFHFQVQFRLNLNSAAAVKSTIYLSVSQCGNKIATFQIRYRTKQVALALMYKYCIDV